MIYQGVYGLEKLACKCNIKHYFGGLVIVSGCKKHRSEKYYECKVCNLHFKHKKEIKDHQWTHAI